MVERALVLGVVALLMAAAALLLWQWSARRQRLSAAARNVGRQVDALLRQPPAVPAGWPGGAAPAMVDPWAREATVPPRSGGAPSLRLPASAAGALAPRARVLAVAAGVAACLLAWLIAGAVAALALALLLPTLAAFGLWLRAQKRREVLIRQLPGFIDAMVRLITIGNSMQAAFQISVEATKPPLRDCLEGASSLVRAGLDLDTAINQMARGLDVEELALLASILGVGVRYGGRTDLLLERVAHFMRDRELAQRELVAMSAETRMSAWILGLLPICVGGVVVMLNPAYFFGMLRDPTGQMLAASGLGLQVVGAALLYRLARVA